jgi:hypothetical protein
MNIEIQIALLNNMALSMKVLEYRLEITNIRKKGAAEV